MCGGTLQIDESRTVATCEYCGTEQTLPKLDDDRRANFYDRANHFRRNNDFDKAAVIYEQLLTEDNTDAEAYWSLVLCRYGIEYVEDPATHKRIPTVNRAQYTSVFDDDNYKSALRCADSLQRGIYEQEAKQINEIQKGILAISQKEEPFDVFICYKETDANGRRTPDSVLANDLYHQLTNEGFKVFFSRITLEDKLGTAYEPYIFAALNSAKVMVVLGTKQEYFNAVWVKNEWSRYLSLVKQSGGEKVLIPAYKDMDPYDLPDEFSHLQAQDMSKLGFMQDLIRGIKKIAGDTAPKAEKPTPVSTYAPAEVDPLLKRAFMFLEDGDWKSADEYCEKVLDRDPENGRAYLGKLMAELKVNRQEALKNLAQPFDDRDLFAKATRFSDKQLADELRGYIAYIKERNENTRLEGIYSSAKGIMLRASTKAEFTEAVDKFESISGYKDAESLAESCREKADAAGKDEIYKKAEELMSSSNVSDITSAINKFESISGWKDADEKAYLCREKLSKREKEIKRNNKIAAISALVVTAVIIFVIVLVKVIIPNSKYNSAVDLMEAGKYEEAIPAFREIDDYKDSAEKIVECKEAIIESDYNNALELMNSGKYDEAILKFNALNGYKDSNDKIIECKYNKALALINSEKYEKAISVFEELDGYKDSKEKISECETAVEYKNAIELMNEGKYEEAIQAFKSLKGYKDSEAKISECESGITESNYNDAIELMDSEKYVEAYETFISLNGYKDSTEKAASIFEKYKSEKFKAAKKGDYIYFGEYEQDNDTSNGKEDIEWLVLKEVGNSILVVSKYGLESMPYNTTGVDVTWETCTLRKWLNETFVNDAFSAEEQSKIEITNVSADKNPNYNTNPGSATQDKVFLLSTNSFDTEYGKCAASKYAKEHGAYTFGAYTTESGELTCQWWLRTPGIFQRAAACVYCDGSIKDRTVDRDDICVRPAMWIYTG